jgi:hypothetical protein
VLYSIPVTSPRSIIAFVINYTNRFSLAIRGGRFRNVSVHGKMTEWDAAKNQVARNAHNTVFGAKRLVGW